MNVPRGCRLSDKMGTTLHDLWWTCSMLVWGFVWQIKNHQKSLWVWSPCCWVAGVRQLFTTHTMWAVPAWFYCPYSFFSLACLGNCQYCGCYWLSTDDGSKWKPKGWILMDRLTKDTLNTYKSHVLQHLKHQSLTKTEGDAGECSYRMPRSPFPRVDPWFFR